MLCVYNYVITYCSFFIHRIVCLFVNICYHAILFFCFFLLCAFCFLSAISLKDGIHWTHKDFFLRNGVSVWEIDGYQELLHWNFVTRRCLSDHF